jgi:hypothetical protein
MSLRRWWKCSRQIYKSCLYTVLKARTTPLSKARRKKTQVSTIKPRLGEKQYLHEFPGQCSGTCLVLFSHRILRHRSTDIYCFTSRTFQPAAPSKRALPSRFIPFHPGLALRLMTGARGDTENGVGSEELKDTATTLPNGGYGWIIVGVAVAMNAVTWGMPRHRDCCPWIKV